MRSIYLTRESPNLYDYHFSFFPLRKDKGAGDRILLETNTGLPLPKLINLKGACQF
jgi:hypothetical protein